MRGEAKVITESSAQCSAYPWEAINTVLSFVLQHQRARQGPRADNAGIASFMAVWLQQH